MSTSPYSFACRSAPIFASLTTGISSAFGITAKRSRCFAGPPPAAVCSFVPPQLANINTAASTAARDLKIAPPGCLTIKSPRFSASFLQQQLIDDHDDDDDEPDNQAVVERRAGNLRQRVAQHAEDQRAEH